MNAGDEIRAIQRQLSDLNRRLISVRASGGGEANTASNVGAGGTGVFDAKVGIDLQFRNINAASARISVAHDAPNKEVDIDVVEAQVNHDALLNYAADQHVVLPNIIANVLTDHNLAAHTALGLFDASADVDHDLTTNYVANQHIDHTAVTLTAGVGLTGGGDISANRAFDVDVGIADDDIVQVDGAPADDEYAKFTANGLEGRSYAEVLADLSGQALAAFDWNGQNLTNLGTGHDAFSDFVADEHIDYTGILDVAAKVVKTTAKARACRTSEQSDLINLSWSRVDLDIENYDPGANFNNGLLGSGTATGTTANHLIDAGYDFDGTGIRVGMRIKNTTDSTYTYITAVAAGDLTLRDDLFVNGENWEIKATRFVVPVTGYYFVSAVLTFINVIADKSYVLSVRVNNTEKSSNRSQSSSTGALVSSLSDIVYLSQNDYINLWTYNDSGVNTVDLFAVASGVHTFMTIHLLSV